MMPHDNWHKIPVSQQMAILNIESYCREVISGHRDIKHAIEWIQKELDKIKES